MGIIAEPISMSTLQSPRVVADHFRHAVAGGHAALDEHDTVFLPDGSGFIEDAVENDYLHRLLRNIFDGNEHHRLAGFC